MLNFPNGISDFEQVRRDGYFYVDRTQLQDYQQILKAQYGERLRLRIYAVVALGFNRLLWEAL